MIRMKAIARKAQAMYCCAESAAAKLEDRVVFRGVLFFILFALMALSVYLLNVNMPLILDDYDFMYSWATGESVSGFADVIRSQLVHYQIWGGRMLHVFTQLFLYLGKGVFNVVNTIMFMLLLLEIYMIARPAQRRFCWPILLIAYLVLMTMLPFFGTVFLWLTGSCIYLFGTVLALVPMVIIRSVKEGGLFSRKIAAAVLCLPIGILAGWTNENTTCGMIAVIFVFLARDYFRAKKIELSLILLFVGQCIGAGLLLLAPGNALRASGYVYDSMLVELLRRFVSVTAYGMSYLGVLLAFVILLAAGIGKKNGARIEWTLALVFAALISVYAMVGSPELSDRTYTGSFVLILTALLVLVGDMDRYARNLDAAKLAVLPLLIAFAAYTAYHGVSDVRSYASRWNEEVQRIESACLAGKNETVIDPIYSASRFTMDIVMSSDAHEWPNSTLSKYYGIDIIGR